MLAAEAPLVLVIEDLHWSDVSTIDLLATLAQRPKSARLLLLGTYRPADAVLYAKNLRDIVQELRGRSKCEEMMLELLSQEDVATYLEGRLSGGVSADLATKIFQRTNGNPLFMVNLIEDLIQRQLLVQYKGRWTVGDQARRLMEAVPETLRSLISRCLNALPGGQKLILKTASVAGLEFSGAAIVGGIEQTISDVDAQCETLAAQGQFIEAAGFDEWPDGTLSGRYRFQHPLYHDVLYEQIGEVRRAQLHRRIGGCLETGYGEQTNEVAAVLAEHFDSGRDTDRAIRYSKLAAEQALSRHVYPEAIDHLRWCLEMLRQLPETAERDQRELDTLILLGPALVAARGYTAPEVEQTYERAHALCEQFCETSHRFPVLWGLWMLRLVRADLPGSRCLAKRLVELAQATRDPGTDLVAHDAFAQSLFFWVRWRLPECKRSTSLPTTIPSVTAVLPLCMAQKIPGWLAMYLMP